MFYDYVSQRTSVSLLRPFFEEMHPTYKITIILDASLAPVVPVYLNARLFKTPFYSMTAETTTTS